MWENLKPLMAEFFIFGLKIVRFFWAALKWLAAFVVELAGWLYELVTAYVKLVLGLFTGHLYGIGAMLIVLVLGYLVVNVLQKRKSFIDIPWYKEPRNQAFILVPLVTSFLAVATNPTMVDFKGGGKFFFDVFGHSPLLGPPGHLGVPTTIWALIISFIFVVMAGALALKKPTTLKKRKKAAVRRSQEVAVKKEEPSIENAENEEAMILNEQPGWYE